MRNLISSVFGATLALVLVVTCNSPPSSTGNGDSGLSFDIAGAEAGGPACTPYTQFCDGNKLVSCTRSGQDATLVQDCGAFYYATAANPGKCWDALPSGGGASCGGTQPLCSYNLSQPVAATADNYVGGYDANKVYCTFTPACAGARAMFQFIKLGSGGCGSTHSITVTIDRAVVSPGQTVSFPSTAVTMSYGGAVTCSTWAGTLQFVSDVPSWGLNISANCTEAGKNVGVAASFSGVQ